MDIFGDSYVLIQASPLIIDLNIQDGYGIR